MANMKCPRPKFMDSSVETQIVRSAFSPDTATAPKFDTPISPRDNFRRCIERRNPLWMPNALTDRVMLCPNEVALHDVRGMQIHSDFGRRATEDYQFKDWFNTDWTWVCSAGGAMLTPGTQLLDDITQWEKEVVFPDLSEWGLRILTLQNRRHGKNIWNRSARLLTSSPRTAEAI